MWRLVIIGWRLNRLFDFEIKCRIVEDFGKIVVFQRWWLRAILSLRFRIHHRFSYRWRIFFFFEIRFEVGLSVFPVYWLRAEAAFYCIPGCVVDTGKIE